MEYTFKQLPNKYQKKLLFFIVGTSLISLLVLSFVAMYFIIPLDLPEWLNITLFVVCFLLLGGISAYRFSNKYATTKTIKLTDNFIEVIEKNPQISSSHEVNINDATVLNYQLTPSMIKGFRYISGSDEATCFHIMTHDKNYEIVIPEKYNKIVQFKTIREELEKWLRGHQIKEW